MKHVIISLIFSILFVACSQKEPAGVDFLGKNYYGKNNKNNRISEDKNFIIVSKGDTLTKISKKYNININKLAAINNISSDYKIKLGQKLLIDKSNTTSYIAQTQHEIPPVENNYNPYDKVKVKQLEPPKLEANIVKEQKVEPIEEKQIEDEASKKIETITPSVKTTKYIWPLKGRIISGFGPAANGTKNDGINIEAAAGSNIKSVADGVIAYSGNGLKGYGNLVIIKHEENVLSAYAHMNDLIFSKGDKIAQGQIIGHVGQSGDVTSPQLHFALRIDKKPTNPVSMLP